MIGHNKKYFLFIPAVFLAVFLLSGCAKNDQANELQSKLDEQQAKIDELQKEKDEQKKSGNEENEQNTEQTSENTTIPVNANGSTTANNSNSSKNEEQRKQADALKKKQEEQEKAEALALKKKQAEEVEQKKAEEQVQTKTSDVPTKIVICNINGSPDDIAETKAYYRQVCLDYIEKLKKEGEKIVEIREESRRFIIVMEDNPN